MRKHRDWSPEWGSPDYERNFEKFIDIALQSFLEGVDNQELFRRCYVRTRNDPEYLEFAQLNDPEEEWSVPYAMPLAS